MKLTQLLVNFVKLHPDAQQPTYGSEGAAGMDFYAPEDVLIPPHARGFFVKLGLAVEIPEGYELQMRSRSGMSTRTPLRMSTGVGTIDSDYRGELAATFDNLSDTEFLVHRGDRVAQGVITAVAQARFIQVAQLSESRRGTGGWGSTGK